MWVLTHYFRISALKSAESKPWISGYAEGWQTNVFKLICMLGV